MGLAGECIRELRTKVAEWISIVELPPSGGRDNLVRHSVGDGETSTSSIAHNEPLPGSLSAKAPSSALMLTVGPIVPVSGAPNRFRAGGA